MKILFQFTFLMLSSAGCLPAADVLMQHNDPFRTGANLAEKKLTTATVNVGRFGRRWNLYADGQVVAQPLYVEGLAIDTTPNPATPLVQGTFNAVVIATMHNTIFVYDADNERPGPQGRTVPLWARWLGPTRLSAKDVDMWSTNDPEWGILSTPVISPDRSTLYVVSWNSSQADGIFFQLHALDLHSGAYRKGPVRIRQPQNDASNPCGDQNVFNPCKHKQRPALLFHQGHVFVAFGGDGNRGLLLAMDGVTLQEKGFWTSTPSGANGGLWQSGQGPAVDAAGNILLSTGNGDFGGANFGNSLVKLHFDGSQFQVLDWFTPCNSKRLNEIDLDFGSSGPLLINSNPPSVVAGGKEGVLYAIPQNSLGKHVPSNLPENCGNAPQVQTVAAFPQVTHGGQVHFGNIHGSPVYWKAQDAERIYVWGENSNLKAYRFKQGKILDTQNPKLSGFRPPDGMPGGMLALSANGNKNGTGILWGVVPLDGDANKERGVQGILVAMDAQDVSRTLWTSEQSAQRDRLGLFPKFSNPMVAGGKVFVATYGNAEERRVYGDGQRPQQMPNAYYVAVYGLDPVQFQTENKDSDDLTMVRAASSPLQLNLANCLSAAGGAFDCTKELGAANQGVSFHQVIVPANVNALSCSLLSVTTAIKNTALADATGIGFFSNTFTGGNRTAENAGLFIAKADLKSSGTGTFQGGAPATLHEFVGVVSCPGTGPDVPGRTFKPYAQFEAAGKVFRNWDRFPDTSISPAQPSIDRRANVLVP